MKHDRLSGKIVDTYCEILAVLDREMRVGDLDILLDSFQIEEVRVGYMSDLTLGVKAVGLGLLNHLGRLALNCRFLLNGVLERRRGNCLEVTIDLVMLIGALERSRTQLTVKVLVSWLLGAGPSRRSKRLAITNSTRAGA